MTLLRFPCCPSIKAAVIHLSTRDGELSGIMLREQLSLSSEKEQNSTSVFVSLCEGETREKSCTD